jgi:hypothetical protein
MKGFNLKKLNKVEGREWYQVENSNTSRFAAFENLDAVDIDRAWETIRENIKISAKEKHRPWFKKANKPCSGYRIQTK